MLKKKIIKNEKNVAKGWHAKKYTQIHTSFHNKVKVKIYVSGWGFVYLPSLLDSLLFVYFLAHQSLSYISFHF